MLLYETPKSTLVALALDAWIYISWLPYKVSGLKDISEDNLPLWLGFITSVEIFDE